MLVTVRSPTAASRFEDAPSRFIGRRNERERIQALLTDAGQGLSGTLVIRGAAGIGKSSLVSDAVRALDDYQLVSIDGVETEVELPYAALHRALTPYLPTVSALPEPQRDALQIIFGQKTGPAPDAFLVGLATLTLVADAAESAALVWITDDAHWIDRSSLRTLAFVARRLLAEGVVMLFCVRDAFELPELAALPTLHLGGLEPPEALALVHTTETEIEASVARRVLAESEGNPLALIEFSRGLAPSQLAGDRSIPEPLPLTGRLESLFSQRIQDLPAAAQTLLLVAAVEPAADANLLWGAAERLGVSAADVPLSDVAAFLMLHPETRFRHPLIRSAVHSMAPVARRREAHAALAQAFSSERDRDRRAWHLAGAADGPDEDVAEELERVAEAARTRGGYIAEARFLSRAAELSPEPKRGATRALASIEASLAAGETQQALVTLNVLPRPDRSDLRARALSARGKTAFALARFEQARVLLIEAAESLVDADPEAVRTAWLNALYAAVTSCGPADLSAFMATAQQASAAQIGQPEGDSLTARLLAGFMALVNGDFPNAKRQLGQALAAPAQAGFDTSMSGLEPWLMLYAAAEVLDLNRGRAPLNRMVIRDRAAGALPSLGNALGSLMNLEARSGHLARADQLAAETAEVHRAFNADPHILGFMTHFQVAVRADDPDAGARIKALRDMTAAAAFGAAELGCLTSLAILHLGKGEYPAALHAGQMAECSRTPLSSLLSLPDLVEAAGRSDELDYAARMLTQLEARVEAAPTPWGRGLLARSGALLASGNHADALYRDAISSLHNASMPLDEARAHLVYGEWLRRGRRRTDAAGELSAASEMFDDMGAGAFARRAAVELNAAGSRPRRRVPETRDDLTTQERQVAAAATGRSTNREIAAAMFLSEATIAYHLRKVFQKLDITSRRQLSSALSSSRPPGDQALRGGLSASEDASRARTLETASRKRSTKEER
jgi:DNA-binding CsgD family transcriptional regulator